MAPRRSPPRSSRPSAPTGRRSDGSRPGVAAVVTAVSTLALLVVGMPRTVYAQRAVQGALDVGVARARQSTAPAQPPGGEFQAGVVALTGQVAGRALALTGQALLTGAADSAGAAQARVGLMGRVPRATWLGFDGALAVTGFGLGASGIPDSRLGGSSVGALRVQAELDRGIRAGIGAGYEASRLRRITEIPRPRLEPERQGERFDASAIEVAGWGGYGPVRLDGSMRRLRTNDYALVEASAFGLDRHASAYDLRDVNAALTLTYGRIDASVHNAWRRGVVATRGRSEALGYSASLRLTRTLALFGSHGSQLADPLHGIPQARVSTVALRVTFGGISRPSPRAGADGEASIELTRGDTARRILVLRVRDATASRVEAAGTWNDWTPLPLTREGDMWVARIPISSGAHRIAVRIESGAWRAPRGTAKSVDEFGVEAGLVIVP